MTPEQKLLYHAKEMCILCAEQGWGDPFSYARLKEIQAAIVLGHRVAPTLSGPDAFNQKNEPVEYKSTTGKRCKGSYTGISVQETWKEQDRYLLEKKLAKYPEHYYNRFGKLHLGGGLVESWMMSGRQVYDILLPKLKKKFPDVLKKKDPRLSANVTWTEIQKYGKKLI